MNPSNSQPNAVKEMEAVISRFSAAIQDAIDITDSYYQKANSLTNFDLSSSSDESKENGPGGSIPQLSDLVDRLVYLNRRNLEIIKHMNVLI